MRRAGYWLGQTAGQLFRTAAVIQIGNSTRAACDKLTRTVWEEQLARTAFVRLITRAWEQLIATPRGQLYGSAGRQLARKVGSDLIRLFIWLWTRRNKLMQRAQVIKCNTYLCLILHG
jgi:hypothetical protein